MTMQGPDDRVDVGLLYVEGLVSGPSGGPIAVKFLVDSGASYSLLPDDVWRRLGLSAKRSMTFVLADGTEMKRDVSECHVKLPQGEGHTPVILGEPGDVALLGVITLEVLGFVLNPFDRSIRPMHLTLMRLAA